MKTITMMDLRKSPGEYAHDVYRHGEAFLVTSQGRPVFKMVPVDWEVTQPTVINRDGTLTGPKPLTFREKLGGEYGAIQ
jgi:antitoxin (DNA-binding transcriptional repressor) of toxin-antitoxin stability system